MIRPARHAQTQRFARHLIVPDCFAIGMQQDVRVRFDQSRHQGQAREIDHLRVRRSLDFARWANCFDLLAMDQHHPPVMQLRRLAIEDVRGFEKIDSLGWFGRRLCLRRRVHLNDRTDNDQTYD